MLERNYGCFRANEKSEAEYIIVLTEEYENLTNKIPENIKKN